MRSTPRAALVLALSLLACGQPDLAPLDLAPLVQPREQAGAAGIGGGAGASAGGTAGASGSGAGGEPAGAAGAAGLAGGAGAGGGSGEGGAAGSGEGGAGSGAGGSGGMPSLCEGKGCGAPCSPCVPGAPGCNVPEGRCDPEGLCRLGPVLCPGGRCSGKSCGEPCEPCPPGEPSCLPGFCDEGGACLVVPPACGSGGQAGAGGAGAGGESGTSGQSGGGGAGAGASGQGGEGGGGPGSCKDPTDCPEFPCEICPDGSFNCPQVSCLDGQCAVQVSPCPLTCEQQCNVSSCESCVDGSFACKFGQCIDNTCVLVGDECPPPPDCSPVDAKGQGPCAQVLGFVWGGEDCTGIAGCSCVGAGCAQVAATYEACMATRGPCIPPCSGKACGDTCEQCGPGFCLSGLCDGEGVCGGIAPCP